MQSTHVHRKNLLSFFLSQKFKSQICSFLLAQVFTQLMSMYTYEDASLCALALETAALLPEALMALEATARST